MSALRVGPMIVAEIGANHLGSIHNALALIEAAHEAGADAVKFQTFIPAQMADAGVVMLDGPWKGRQLQDLYHEALTPREWHPRLYAAAREMGLEPFSSVFHPDDIEFLERLGCPRYKVSSFEINDIPLLEAVARTRKPAVLSTGMATYEEIGMAVAVLLDGCQQEQLTVLKCTSAYPADCSDANLRAMEYIRQVMPVGQVGISDHTPGATVAIAATALGAWMIEKHLTLNRAYGGPDAAFSMEPGEFRAMVSACRDAARALGHERLMPTEREKPMLPLRRPPGGKRGDLMAVSGTVADHAV